MTTTSAAGPNVGRTALIVGAGIGGLSSAIALRQAGWHTRIFERAAAPRELGFGLALAPNAIAALKELNVADRVQARAFIPRRGELRRMDGAVLKRAELPPDFLGGPMIMALRPALHGALLDAVGLDTITLSTEATSFTATASTVTLHTRQGENDDVVGGDLLVGADGVHSVIRSALHPSEPPPRSSGIVAVRGVVHDRLQHLGDLSAVMYFGRGVEAVVIRASDTGIYWFVSVNRELIPPGMRNPAMVLAHLSPRFDQTFRAVTAGTIDLRFDELVDRDPLARWGSGVVTLLGDAAHPLLPHTGQGAAQAIVDAVTLARCLDAERNVVHALRAYERERQPRTAALARQGRRTARLMRTTNPAVCYAREIVARMMPITMFVKLYARINRRAGTSIRQ